MRRKEAAQQGHSLASHPRLDADRVGPHYEEPQYEQFFDDEDEGDEDEDEEGYRDERDQYQQHDQQDQQHYKNSQFDEREERDEYDDYYRGQAAFRGQTIEPSEYGGESVRNFADETVRQDRGAAVPLSLSEERAATNPKTPQTPQNVHPHHLLQHPLQRQQQGLPPSPHHPYHQGHSTPQHPYPSPHAQHRPHNRSAGVDDEEDELDLDEDQSHNGHQRHLSSAAFGSRHRTHSLSAALMAGAAEDV